MICPNCGKDNRPDARFCYDCGESFRMQTWTAEVKPVSLFAEQPEPLTLSDQRPVERITHDCPRCGSSQTGSYEMIYTSSTTAGSISGAAYTFGVGATFYGGNSSSQTMLASRILPPVVPQDDSFDALLSAFGIALLVFLVVTVIGVILPSFALLFVGLLVAPTLAIAAAVIVYKRVAKRKKEVYQAKVNEYWRAADIWRRSWLCLRCGHTWQFGK